MIKRILILFLLSGLFGCVLPDYNPSPSNTPSTTLSLPGTKVVETPSTTIAPEVNTTETSQPSDSSTSQPSEPTQTPHVRLTPFITYRYALQSGSPKPMVNFAHPEEACNWMGVGGQIFDLSGNPATGLIVKLTGTLNGDAIDLLALSGGALYLGPGGYEFKVSDHPIESSGTLWLSLLDNQGNALSDPMAISTYAGCDQNFLLVNFTQVIIVENGFQLYLPELIREYSP